MSNEPLVCIGCGYIVESDDGAECADCGTPVVACQECVDGSVSLRCTPCFDKHADKVAIGAGAGVGAVAGLGSVPVIVSGAGVVGGTSAAGVTSALAAVGVGGMVGGVVSLAALPIGAAAAGAALFFGGRRLWRCWRR